MSDWIGKTVIVPALIGAVCGTFFESVAISIGVGLMLCVIWIFGFNYFFEESVNTEDSV